MKLSAVIKPLFANRGHFRSIRHDQIRDLFAEFLTEVCPNMSTELALQPISQETFIHRSANTDDGARLDVKAHNLGLQEELCVFRCEFVTLMRPPTTG